MITIKTGQGELSVESNYDSGVHKGFLIALRQDGDISGVTPEKFLTGKQIHRLELVLMGAAMELLESEL